MNSWRQSYNNFLSQGAGPCDYAGTIPFYEQQKSDKNLDGGAGEGMFGQIRRRAEKNYFAAERDFGGPIKRLFAGKDRFIGAGRNEKAGEI